jgi:hypothetical protein
MGRATVYYRLRLDEQPPVQLAMLQRAGVDIRRYLPSERLPQDDAPSAPLGAATASRAVRPP